MREKNVRPCRVAFFAGKNNSTLVNKIQTRNFLFFAFCLLAQFLNGTEDTRRVFQSDHFSCWQSERSNIDKISRIRDESSFYFLITKRKFILHLFLILSARKKKLMKEKHQLSKKLDTL